MKKLILVTLLLTGANFLGFTQSNHPVTADATVTLDEDNSYTFSTSNFAFSDVDGHNYEAFLLTSLPENGILLYNGNPAETFTLYTDRSLLTFEPVLNANGLPYGNFGFQTKDDGGQTTPAITTGMVAYYPFDLDTDDYSGNNRHATPNGTSYYIGANDFGVGASFDGIDDYISLGQQDNYFSGNTFSVATWVNTSGGDFGIIGTDDWTLSLRNNNYIWFDIKDTGSRSYTQGYTRNAKVHVVMVLDNGVIKLYANGIRINTDLLVTDIPDETLELKVGSEGLSSSKFFNGQIDNLTIYNTALSPTDIDSLYNHEININYSTTDTITINVNPIPDAPTSADKKITITEDNTYTFADLDVGFDDVDGESFDAFQLATLPANGTLYYDGSPASTGVDYTERSKLLFEPVANANGLPYTSFMFNVKDNSGDATTEYSTLANTITFDVTSVLDTPSVSSGNFTVNENLSHALTITASDGDAGDTQTFSISGTDAAAFTINPSTGELTFISVPDYENPADNDKNNIYSIVVTVADATGLTDTGNITVTVQDVDESTLFTTTWQTTTANEQITIPTTGTGYNYTVNWGDGTENTNVTGNISHTYPTAGTHTVSISGDFPRIYFYNSGQQDKIRTVEQWGNIQWTSMYRAFLDCSSLRIPATDAPDLSAVTDMSYMFYSCSSLNDPIDHWDVSNIENMAGMFYYASAFNQSIENWDVGKVANMSRMFTNASAFNQPIGDWDVSNVTDMSSMFCGCNVTDMKFNQDISTWDVSNVTTMNSMLYRLRGFNQYLGSWILNPIVNMEFMYYNNGVDCNTYSATLIGWQKNNPSVTGITLGADGQSYGTNAVDARNTLILTQGWTITGDTPSGGICWYSILPIDLLTISIKTTDNNEVRLNWATATEINNDYFTIERSANGRNWSSLGKVQGKGNSSTIVNYSFLDGHPFHGISYYRLKQTDFDGQATYSEVISIQIEQVDISKIEVYPNPTNTQVTIEGYETELKQINIFNMFGQDVTPLTRRAIISSTKYTIDLSELDSSVYYIKTLTQTKKLILKK